jgi:transcriptional regulator with XRE-family HTH domain
VTGSTAPRADAAPFGVDLRRRRQGASLSLRALAHRAGLAPNTVRNIESGRTAPSPSTLARLRGVPALQLGAAGESADPLQRLALAVESLQREVQQLRHELVARTSEAPQPGV